jgi:hypothetical protein
MMGRPSGLMCCVEAGSKKKKRMCGIYVEVESKKKEEKWEAKKKRREWQGRVS